jgi:putative transposase
MLAKDNGWGYTRILGELRKLNIRSVCRNTVKNILRENGIDTGPQRGFGTWDEFIKIHAATLWQCDFFTKRIVTPKGLRDAFVLVFLHVQTRRVLVTPATQHPGEAWVTEQAAALLKHVENRPGYQGRAPISEPPAHCPRAKVRSHHEDRAMEDVGRQTV